VDFSNILVVCNYIHPFYKTIPFIKNFYRFPNIIFYGDSLWPATDEVILYNQSDSKAVMGKPFGGGFFAYRCMIDAMQRHPNYGGYLFLMDDVLLSVRNFELLPDTLLYLSLPSRTCNILTETPSSNWGWWNQPGIGIKSCQKAYASTPEHFKQTLTRHAGGRDVFFGEPNDCFYLPQQIRGAATEVLSIMSEARVFTEIAIPTGLAMIAPSLQEIDIRYLWGNKLRKQWPLHILPHQTGLHPVKFSDPKVRLWVSKLKKLNLI